MCMSQNFGARWRLQKLSDLAEIWHTCSLGEYLGVFFSFSKILIFGAWGQVFRQNEAKTLGRAGGFKNGPIWLKFGTLVPWVNIWRCFFHFSKVLIFGALGRVFCQNEAKTLGQPGGLKMVRFG